MKSKLLAALLLVSMHATAQGSYISRLWNTKSYDKIIEFASKSETLSGRDNMIIGRAFMATSPSQPQQALIHYDLAVQKRMNSEDLYFFRSQALYELKRLDAALADLEKCLEFRKDHQKYLLFKAAIEYEKGDINAAYKSYFTISELYDKQTPFYMLAVISLQRENYYKAREWIDANVLRFENGKDFWRMTSEQQVELEWRIFKDHEKALKSQERLLTYFPDNASYLINRVCLNRILHKDSTGVWAENDLLKRYNENNLPIEYYKKGSIKVGEYVRDRGVVEDYLTFRPGLFENTKYARFYISESGAIVGKHWAGLKEHPQDSTQKIWDFHRGDARYAIPASDTSYLGFTNLFKAPDSILVSYDDFFILQTDSNAVDSIEISIPEMLKEAPIEPEIMPFEGIPTEKPMEIPEQIEPPDSTSIREE
ncbi:MAG: tetratricopeptide repeat protein [Schleiferiaceae bacterium]